MVLDVKQFGNVQLVAALLSRYLKGFVSTLQAVWCSVTFLLSVLFGLLYISRKPFCDWLGRSSKACTLVQAGTTLSSKLRTTVDCCSESIYCLGWFCKQFRFDYHLLKLTYVDHSLWLLIYIYLLSIRMAVMKCAKVKALL